MKAMSRSESYLMVAVVAALLIAGVGPSVSQHAHYHGFADQRTWLGVPCAMDVLTNLPFAVAGIWGLVVVGLRRAAVWDARWALATVFFAGLCVTAVGSTLYHWAPDNWGLAWDRLGMVTAFAGLLGMAVADRISVRSATLVVAGVMVYGPVSVYVWYVTDNLLPWSVLQGGGMLLVLALALKKPMAGAWGMPLAAIIGVYALAKVLEMEDHAVYALTQGVISGHSLKHLVAACAAIPVLFVMHNGGRVRQPARGMARA